MSAVMQTMTTAATASRPAPDPGAAPMAASRLCKRYDGQAAMDEVSLQLEPGTYLVSLFDTNGKLHLTQKLTGNLVLPVQNLAPGTYLVTAANTKTNQVLRGKLIKQ